MSKKFNSNKEKMKFFASKFAAIYERLSQNASPEMIAYMFFHIVAGYGMRDSWPDIISVVTDVLGDLDEDEDCTCDKCKTKMIEDAMDDADSFLDNVLNSKPSG